MTEYRLSESDYSTLYRCVQLQDGWKCLGIFGRNGGQIAHYKKLERYGYLKFAGYAEFDIDTGDTTPRRCWGITSKGREALARDGGEG